MALAEVALDDRYLKRSGRIYLTGIQALVRLPMLQHERDAARGHRTAGYIAGYRGSPLGNYDQQLLAAKRFLEPRQIVVQPAVNEEMAATALWGTQQVGLDGFARHDGVFGIWYGKGPGVGRSIDAFKHANLAGTAPLGGVLALLGDDHTCESSTLAHQSEYGMVDAMIPVVHPAGVAELIEMGLLGFALSRFAGCWVGVKCQHDTVNTVASIAFEPSASLPVLPDDYELPPGGLNIRRPDAPLAQEERLHVHKLEAAKAFARANRFDRLVFDPPGARLGIVSTGKSHLDVCQALADLGIDGTSAAALGLKVLKVGLVWPLDPLGLRTFARGLETIVVVEEKRGLIEEQLKAILYGQADAPRILGKRDERERPLFPSNGALSPNAVAIALGERVLGLDPDDRVAVRLAELRRREAHRGRLEPPATRQPYFCSGCPHNTSTRVPKGSVARAGIGCHYMVVWMERDTFNFTQMGGEGAGWIGEAPFTERRHVFQNVGDGTYYHSGTSGIRAAVAAGVNITFKILYNDAVAMTGGQPVDGPLTVPQITRQVAAEGVVKIVVVTDEPQKYPIGVDFAPGVQVRHRDELDQVQRELREVEGTSVLIYDQTCAAEKRRRRKRGRMADPLRRVVINEAVCEGCGDCGSASNCVSIVPLETDFGRKRQIDQSSCNKDYSCLKGFCPSFVTVIGADVRKPARTLPDEGGDLPEPARAALDSNFGIIVAGIGGTGVVTIGNLLGMAAHLEGKGAAGIDMNGIAQKGGAVLSHLRIAPTPADIQATRIAPGGAKLLIGCDMVVAAAREALGALDPARGHAVVSSHEVMTGDFTQNADFDLPTEALKRAIRAELGERAIFMDGQELATRHLGDAIFANLLMVGIAYQKGLLPLSAEAIERAIELNGAAVAMNQAAFRLGRRAVLEPQQLARPQPQRDGQPRDLDELIKERAAQLTAHQNAAYAQHYLDLVERVRAAERPLGRSELSEAVARYYYKLLAYKDEYEVARLHTETGFLERLKEQFEPGGRLEVHLSPPILPRRDPHTGLPLKRSYGPWMFKLFRLLARLKVLRGTPFDPFGWTPERKLERRLIADYEDVVEEVLEGLGPETHEVAVELARLPEQIRGFGYVRERHADAAKAREAELLQALRACGPLLSAAE